LKRAEPNAPTGCVPQAADRGGALAPEVDQILGERADDAVAPGVHFADVPGSAQRGLDDAARRRIDHSRDAARLGVEGVSLSGILHDGAPRSSMAES